MNLLEINNKALTLPTIMSIDDEIILVKDLMNVAPEDICNNRHTFFKILDAIEISHTDNGFMELNKNNEHIFLNFSNWLTMLNQQYQIHINDNTIENFKLTVEDVNYLMTRYLV